MDGILKKLKNIPFTGITLYVFGAFFFVMSLCSMILHGYIEGLLFILAAIVTIPLAANQLKKRFNTSILGAVRFLVVFCLVVVAIAAFPATPTAINNNENNSKVIAAPLSEVNGSTIAVPPRLTQLQLQHPLRQQHQKNLQHQLLHQYMKQQNIKILNGRLRVYHI